MADSTVHPDPLPALVLRPSRSKWAGVVATAGCFVAAYGFLIVSCARAMHWTGEQTFNDMLLAPVLVVLIAGGAVSGFGLLFAVGVLVLPGNRLEVDDDGFTLWRFGRRRRIAWRDTCWQLSAGKDSVLCAYDTDIPGGGRLELPFGYGRDPADLARMLNEHRARADAREGFDAVRAERDRDAAAWDGWPAP